MDVEPAEVAGGILAVQALRQHWYQHHNTQQCWPLPSQPSYVRSGFELLKHLQLFPEIVNGCKSKHTGNTRSLRQRDWTAVLAAAAPALLMSRLPHPQNPRDTCSFPGVIIQSTPHVLPHPRAYSTCCDMTISPPTPQTELNGSS